MREMNECNLNLEVIELSIKLDSYVKKEKLNLFDISRAYFEITKVIYEVLTKHVDKQKNLKIAYKEILKLIRCVQNKSVERLVNESLLPVAKGNVRTNWNNLIISLEFLNNEIQNQKKAKFEKSTIVISLIALVLAILAILTTFVT